MQNNNLKKLATILSPKTSVPVQCNHCTESTLHALQSLLHQSRLVCRGCEQTSIFSNTELMTLKLFFKKQQYYFQQI